LKANNGVGRIRGHKKDRRKGDADRHEPKAAVDILSRLFQNDPLILLKRGGGNDLKGFLM